MGYGPVIAAVASLVLGEANAAKTARKRNDTLTRGLLDQSRLSRQANARVNQQLDTLEQSTPDDEFETRSSQIRTNLRKNEALALAGIQATGGGAAVTERAIAARGTSTDFGEFINQQLSGIDAPLLQRQGEGFERADVNNDLATLTRESGQSNFLTQLRIAGIRDNPFLKMLSKGLGAYSAASGFNKPGTIAEAGKLSAPINPSIAASSASFLPGQTFGLEQLIRPELGTIFGTRTRP